MRHVSQIWILVVFLVLKLPAWAQITENEPVSQEKLPKLLVSLQAGVSGLGLELSKPLTSHWSIALGYSYIDANIDFKADLYGLRVRNTSFYASSALQLQARYGIRKNDPIQWVAGLSYIDARSHYRFMQANSITLGTSTFTPEELGSVLLYSSNNWSLVPYLGVHFGRPAPKKRFAFGMDIGMFGINGIHTDVKADGFIAGDESDYQKIKDNLATYKIFPQLNFQLMYKIK